jgi:general secretion pathway protein G
MQPPNIPPPRRTAGFTLIEIMVVVAIIGLLATLVAPNVIKYLRSSKVTVTQAKLKGLKQPIQQYYMIHSRIPESLDELMTEDEMNMKEAYIESREEILDAWGNEIRFERMSNSKYDLISLGADGVEGGEADDRDLHLFESPTTGELPTGK